LPLQLRFGHSPQQNRLYSDLYKNASLGRLYTRDPYAAASCQFAVGNRAVAEIALAGADVQIPPAVYTEVVTRGGARPDALIAARLIQTGYIRLADATEIGSPLEDLQHYQLAQGESEALTLTARLGAGTVMVTDDFLALIVAHRLGTSYLLFLDFVIGRAARGELPLVEAQQIVHAVSPRYPVGFVLHSLAMLRRLQP
jgi:predicted nucleic acid-binding protein